jgi:hypothetical protein
MSAIRVLISRCLALFRKQKLEQELEEELQFHLQQEIDHRMAHGLNP